MEEESAALITSIHSSITTWLTPTILFIFLNLMIATILFTSNLPTNKTPPNQKPQTQNDTVPSPTLLHRLKSFHFYPHTSQQEQPSPITNNHPQQESLETAATQYVFNHPFPHEQQDLQPISSNPKKSDFDPTRFDSDPNHFPHQQDLQPLSSNPKKTDFDPTRLDQTNEVHLSNAETHFVIENYTVEKVTTHFDFGSGRIETENPPEQDTGIVETREEEPETDELASLDEVYSKITSGHVNRTKSDTLPAAGEVPVKLPAKMKKSASLKSPFGHFEEENIVEARRPATEDDDVEVDAKADDFINKFKHQLKLQRLDSIIRYKDMVNRGVESEIR